MPQKKCNWNYDHKSQGWRPSCKKEVIFFLKPHQHRNVFICPYCRLHINYNLSNFIEALGEILS